MTIGLLLTAFGLGLRHGIDWDHIAAIADLSSTAESRRRGFLLSFVYAVGHACIVVALGAVAILFGVALPAGVDVWMGRIVGATLVALGAWVLIELVRKGRDFRLRSRWILVISGSFAGFRRVREANARRRLTIEHDHDHEHSDVEAADGGAESIDHRQPHAHDHDHLGRLAPLPEPVDAGSSSRFRRIGRGGYDHGAGGGAPGHRVGRQRIGHHRHRHSHEMTLAEGGAATGNGTAAGIGLLHGVGFESPTQIAVFVASTSVVGAWSGFGLLLAWVIGLLVANSLLAGLAAFGLLGVERNFAIYAGVATVVGVASVAMGLFMLTGFDGLVPQL